ncbi:ATP-dependent nuclease [Aliarcobacter butzleri]|uniref:ATP-dependent nuclease n=1 Tax=Aliarcobacter butzleri TaxID=28197 RepID=UPI001EDB9A6D|nr:ATP-dependent endonuclease [Aliarcobacter butzleri]MCG3660889.1 ATP-dependent endonuclease [Aliarcobacter butzleri]
MKIKRIEVKNYRLLKKFSLDLEDELSLVIGKNNCGKTSLLTVLDKFLNNNIFTENDFNLDYKKEIFNYLINELPSEETYESSNNGISLRIFIEYDEQDNLSRISEIMLNLENDNNIIILDFEYQLSYSKLLEMLNDFRGFNLINTNNEEKFIYFFKNEYSRYFKLNKQSLEIDNDIITNSICLNNEIKLLNEIINFKFISAKREVSNKDKNKTLSAQTAKIYRKAETIAEQEQNIISFKKELFETDKKLNKNYKIIFKDILNKVETFGGIKKGDSLISINSTLQHRELLDGNTTVMYEYDNQILPEHYNGLGYMNLISMIFEIETLMVEFKKSINEKPADINLLFIEEPEAHTHPQMQYIFINNIKKLLKNGIKRIDGNNGKLQYIITTHSSHIVAESDFNDIKYLKKNLIENSVISKNLKDLENEYINEGKEKNFRFLKQYLTLNRAELFFAEKAVFIEGDTERILLPAMMKKIDEESKSSDNKLLSQNISIIEVGAHSQTFEKFIEFVGIKTLIITDIDSYKEKELRNDDGTPKVDTKGNIIKKKEKCQSSDPDACGTTNYSLLHFHGKSEKSLGYFKSISFSQKILLKNVRNKWYANSNGNLALVYQTKEENSRGEIYHSRSFEDAFFHINKDFLQKNINNFNLGLKNPRFIDKRHSSFVNDPYYWAENCVDKKPSFAIEILMNSVKSKRGKKSFINWNIPLYIKEGLLWLRDN